MSLFEEEVQRCMADARRWAEKQNLVGQNLILAMTDRYAEVRWLERDYEDERNGDWTR